MASRQRLQTRVGLIQMRCRAERELNWELAGRLIAQAKRAGANVVCLPELFAWPYPAQEECHDRFAQAEPIPGPTTDWLVSQSKQHDIVVIGSVFERRAAGMYHNTAVVVEADGTLAGRYRKMHIPDDPHYYEKFYFAPGDLDFQVIPTSAGRLGIAICWDQWFPEAARLMTLAGAEILFYPTAIGWLHEEKEHWGPTQVSAWQTSMRAHAIANGLFVVAVNRVGTEDAIEFWGRSFCANPYGEIIARADNDSESTVVIAECDRGQIETARTHWPFLRDRRIDAYGPLSQRWLDR